MARPGLLDGVRVLDLSRVLAGPYAAQVLAEMGADVVKVEHPSGDPARGIGPHVDGTSLYFASLNTGKRGIVLDLADDAGREALDAVLAGTDIVVENFRPAAARSLGCDPATLHGRHPELTIVTVSGYARESERADDPAFDLTVQAESGIMSVTGEPDGPPVRAGVPVGDLAAGLWAALGGVAAYSARLRDGRGRHVEVPLIDAATSLLSYVATAAAANATDPPKVGSGHHSIVPYGAYPTSDGWVAVAVIGDKFWGLLCDALGLDDLSARRDLDSNRGREQARAEVDGAVARAMSGLSTGEALDRLGDVGVPAAPVNGVLDAMRSPYARGRGFVAEVPGPPQPYHVVQGPLRTGAAPRGAPRLGEHTEEVLTDALGAGSPLLVDLLGTA